ncbi:MAG TPA: zf-HC2 domain-containing protein [Chitinispirillaceae bacterium]|nr:zf-HC2 domain-containing protein [Chitinispirillaceae bacterium]
MKNCRIIRLLISRSLDGDLSAEETAEMTIHTLNCSRCNNLLKNYSTLKKLVASSFSEQPLPADIASSIIATSEKRKKQKAWSLAWLISSAALISICLFGLKMIQSFKKNSNSITVVWESRYPTSMSMPLSSLIYYEQFASEAIHSQFVSISPQYQSSGTLTDQQTISTYYNSPLFADGLSEEYQSVAGGSNEAYQ